MYSKEFSKIYNTEWASFSEMLADKLLNIVKDKQSLLDLGCGTGNFIIKMSKHFKKCVGIDISPNMINIAKQNCPNCNFIVGDVTNFNLHEKFNLITCNFDMINHLNNIDDWSKMFLNAYNHLADKGYFVFDFNTIYKMSQLDYKEHFRETKKYNYKSKDTFIDDNHIRMYIAILDKHNKKLAEVDQIESFYNESIIIDSLKSIGFVNIKLLNNNFDEIKTYDIDRIYIICEKRLQK